MDNFLKLILICQAQKILVLITLSSNEGSVSLRKCTDSQNLCCLHTQSMDVDEDSDQKLDFGPARYLSTGFLEHAIRTTISCAGLYDFQPFTP